MDWRTAKRACRHVRKLAPTLNKAWLARTWPGLCLTRVGSALDPHVHRDFRAAIADAEGVDAQDARELRHSFVSLMSHNGVPLEECSRLVGPSSTVVIELVYRKQIRPVLQAGATVMHRIFDHEVSSLR